MNLTKEIKEKWLTALKSGEYTQGPRKLYNIDTNRYCCLGVLANIHPDIKISSGGVMCEYKGIVTGYKPFYELIGGDKVEELYRTNDSSYHKGLTDYSGVIPIIEALETID